MKDQNEYGYNSHDFERMLPEPNKSSLRSVFQRDRARILHSSVLRRLGGKTQVLQAGTGDFVRNRLTHSLEVAQVGREIARMLGANPDVVDAACLSHDLGHPPFGHNGESALAEVAKDIGGFEGNAQTLRIITRLEPKTVDNEGKSYGLNLSRATLDATVKYPWKKNQGPTTLDGKQSSKFGVYEDDMPVFAWIREGVPNNERCVEAQIMNISDDIAYSVHDVEDAIQRGSLKLEDLSEEKTENALLAAIRAWYNPVGLSDQELHEAWRRIRSLPLWMKEFSGLRKEIAQIKNLTSDIIGKFVIDIKDATRNAGYAGDLARYRGNLVVPSTALAEMCVIKGIAVLYVMEPRETEPEYIRERTIIYDLCDALIQNNGEGIEPQFQEDYRRANDDNEKLRVVVDQVACLTDYSANKMHAEVCGVYSSI